ncbi:MAG: hypothetical protein QNJ12_07165 [Ilumatobacter sp.]|uniref:hypothetical protein n=1 Tax=Ilumatobacter sp. TaxID=1967498 RepID=UPI00260BC514|nr:hypothetical protein [Ilumatobacter sp.]MDJ0768557.1 hypothetical protein [Ilumatobacter sp.]
MSDFNFRETESFGAFADRFRAAESQPSEVFIALGESAKKANVVRDDFAVPVLEVDTSVFDDFFGGRPQIVNKVVSQSIPAGTVVTQGTAVNLVLAPASEVPGKVFQGGHVGLNEDTMASVYELYVGNNVEVNRMLSRRSSPADLSPEDVEIIKTVAADNELNVSDQVGETVEDLFVSWQHAYTFAR